MRFYASFCGCFTRVFLCIPISSAIFRFIWVLIWNTFAFIIVDFIQLLIKLNKIRKEKITKTMLLMRHTTNETNEFVCMGIESEWDLRKKEKVALNAGKNYTTVCRAWCKTTQSAEKFSPSMKLSWLCVYVCDMCVLCNILCIFECVYSSAHSLDFILLVCTQTPLRILLFIL